MNNSFGMVFHYQKPINNIDMKRVKKELEMLVADEGKVLEVFYEGETEPVYYDRLFVFLLSESDVVKEVDKVE